MSSSTSTPGTTWPDEEASRAAGDRRFIEDEAERPWFAWVNPTSPHFPYDAAHRAERDQMEARLEALLAR